MEIRTHRSTPRVFLMASNASFGALFLGYLLGYINVSLTTINKVFSIPPESQASVDGMISALLPIGAAIGAFFAESLLSRCSPRHAMMVIDGIGVVGLLLGEIVDVNTLYVSRFLLGLTAGLNSAVIPVYVKAFTPLTLQGPIGSIFAIGITIGLFIALLIGFGYDNDPNGDFWRTVFILPIVFAALRTLILGLIYREEPPLYHLQKGEIEEAKQVLSTIYYDSYINGQLAELQIEQAQADEGQSYRDLLGPMYFKRLISGLFVSFLQQASGISTVVFYSTAIFQSVTTNSTTVNLLNVAFGLGNFITCTAGGGLMRTYGRKQLLIWSDIVCGVSLVVLGLFSYLLTVSDSVFVQIMTVVPVYTHLIGYNIALGPVVWVYMADVLPQNGLSLCAMVLWISSSLVTLTFPILIELIGIFNCFFFFAGLCFVSYFILQAIVHETKDRTPKSIHELFSGLLQTAHSKHIEMTDMDR